MKKKKVIIVINGAGGVGKDTLINFIAEKHPIYNASAIAPIKQAALQLGWDEGKTLKDRKFLSDLKMLVTEYNDCSLNYLLDEVHRFCLTDHDIMFVHIREPKEIEKFVDAVRPLRLFCPPVVTLLVMRNTGTSRYGNEADDGVGGYEYDFVFDNNYPLGVAKEDFKLFIDHIYETANDYYRRNDEK